MSNKTFDPDPRRRKGGLPKSIIRKYGISKRAWQVFRGEGTHDPGRSGARADHKPYGVGRRGGVYWSGAKKRRYDPGWRAEKLRGYGRRARAYGSKVEAIINKHAGKIGAGLAALAGFKTALDSYTKNYGKDAFDNYVKCITGGTISDGRTIPAEISRLWAPEGEWNTLNYLQYKFLGLDPVTSEYIGSAWVAPFWASLIGWIVSKLKVLPPRFNRPLEGISKGALVISTIGALALPGCPGPASPSGTSSPTNHTTHSNPPGRSYVYGK